MKPLTVFFSRYISRIILDICKTVSAFLKTICIAKHHGIACKSQLAQNP